MAPPPTPSAASAAPSASPTPFPDATGVQHAFNLPLIDSGFGAHAEVVAALRDGPLRGFDMGATAVVGETSIEGRVWLRADGQLWTLTTLDASLLALLVRMERFRAADLLADALVRASIDAERRVDAIHRWSGRIRPTEDGE